MCNCECVPFAESRPACTVPPSNVFPVNGKKQRSGLWKCHSVPGLALRGPREPGGGAWPGCRFRGDRIMCHTAAAASSSPGGWGQAERGHGGGSLLHCLFHQLSGEQGARLNGHSKICTPGSWPSQKYTVYLASRKDGFKAFIFNHKNDIYTLCVIGALFFHFLSYVLVCQHLCLGHRNTYCAVTKNT